MGSTEGTLDEAKGRVKQAAGDLANDKSLHREGTADRAGAKVKNATSKAKEKIDETVDRVTNAIRDRN
jgi:uncharacterized protein YjbJ (UPF0337 family)